MMEKDARIYVAGHRGMLGSALLRSLKAAGYTQLLTRRRCDLNLCERSSVDDFFQKERPDYVFLTAARVGGILDNSRHPVDFGRDNALIQLHVMDAAHQVGVRKLLFTASSCIYPRSCSQPMHPEKLLSGPFEPTNALYGMAKLFGVHMCQAYQQQFSCRFISVLPCNLFGPGDNFDPTSSHVVAGLLQKFHQAKVTAASSVTLWGDGTPRREFMYVDDCADACIFLMENYEKPAPINVGVGADLSIAELATLIAEVTGFKGQIHYDTTLPNGMPRKLMDNTELKRLGWKPRYSLITALRSSYEYYKKTLSNKLSPV